MRLTLTSAGHNLHFCDTAQVCHLNNNLESNPHIPFGGGREADTNVMMITIMPAPVEAELYPDNKG